MLNSEHAIVEFRNGQAFPDRLTRLRHAPYVEYARRMIATYTHGIGRTRRDLHRAIAMLLAAEPDCPPRRVEAFCKLLDDVGEYDRDSGDKSASLRLKVFDLASRYHPLVTRAERIFEHVEDEVKQLIATQLGQSWQQIDRTLYADVIEFQTLQNFDDPPTPQALLARYNVAQIQACLYRCVAMTLHLTSDFKRIVRQIRLLRLLHEIHRLEGDNAGGAAYRIDLSGPASILHNTRRYGVDMARLVPVLLACQGWSLEATIQTPWGRPAHLRLSSADGLSSHLPPSEPFDSTVEQAFFDKWGPDPRDGWRLFREDVILQQGQSVFFPDFVFRRGNGEEAYLEVVAFWTPQYLEQKRQTLLRFGRHRILLAVAEACLREGTTIPDDVIVFKTALKPDAVLGRLKRGAAVK